MRNSLEWMVHCYKSTKSGAGICSKEDQLGHHFEGFVVYATELRLDTKDIGAPVRVLSKEMRWTELSSRFVILEQDTYHL